MKHFGYGSDIARFKMWSYMNRPMESQGQPLPAVAFDLSSGTVASLPAWRLALRENGTVTIEPTHDPKDRVWGVVYDLTDPQMERLRKGEGRPRNDYGEIVPVVNLDGFVLSEVLTWYWPPSTCTDQPAARYHLELIAQACLDRRIDQAYIVSVLRPLMQGRKRLGVNVG